MVGACESVCGRAPKADDGLTSADMPSGLALRATWTTSSRRDRARFLLSDVSAESFSAGARLRARPESRRACLDRDLRETHGGRRGGAMIYGGRQPARDRDERSGEMKRAAWWSVGDDGGVVGGGHHNAGATLIFALEPPATGPAKVWLHANARHRLQSSLAIVIGSMQGVVITPVSHSLEY